MSKPRVGVNFVYQERQRDGKGHVLLKNYTQTMVDNYCKNPRVHSPGQNYRSPLDFDGDPEWMHQKFYYETGLMDDVAIVATLHPLVIVWTAVLLIDILLKQLLC